MVSLRFPFSWFPPPAKTPNFRRCTTIAAVCAAGVAISVKTLKKKDPIGGIENPFVDYVLSSFGWGGGSSLGLGCVSLSSGESGSETINGAEFPTVIREGQALLGVGLRRKCVFGVKNIDVYAFGVYADENDVQKNLKKKYGRHSADELKEDKNFNEDILTSDVNLTVRLQIVYSRLSIGSVRKAFEDSVGSRLQKFGGSDNKELLHRFTSQFKDELKIPKGSVIELSRQYGHVLHTIIDGQEVGSIQSKLLCQSVFDLYVGDDPFDQQAKQSVMLKLAHVLDNKSVTDSK